MKRFGILCLVGAFVFVLPAVHAEAEKEEEGNGKKKVTICHVTGATKTTEDGKCIEKCKEGTPVWVCVSTKVVAIQVDDDAVDAHLDHGDFIGKKCPEALTECHCECVEDEGGGKDEELPEK